MNSTEQISTSATHLTDASSDIHNDDLVSSTVNAGNGFPIKQWSYELIAILMVLCSLCFVLCHLICSKVHRRFIINSKEQRERQMAAIITPHSHQTVTRLKKSPSSPPSPTRSLTPIPQGSKTYSASQSQSHSPFESQSEDMFGDQIQIESIGTRSLPPISTMKALYTGSSGERVIQIPSFSDTMVPSPCSLEMASFQRDSNVLL